MRVLRATLLCGAALAAVPAARPDPAHAQASCSGGPDRYELAPPFIPDLDLDCPPGNDGATAIVRPGDTFVAVRDSDGFRTWTLQNQGTIHEPGVGTAVELFDAGSRVLNEGTIFVSSPDFGLDAVFLHRAGQVTNLGVIEARGATAALESNGIQFESGVGDVLNEGTIIGGDHAIYLKQGGTITNTATGVIESGAPGRAFARAIAIENGAAGIDNAGRIESFGSNAIHQRGGDRFVLLNRAGAVIRGVGGLSTSSASSDVTNHGVIASEGVAVEALGDDVRLTNSGAITGNNIVLSLRRVGNAVIENAGRIAIEPPAGSGAAARGPAIAATEGTVLALTNRLGGIIAASPSGDGVQVGSPAQRVTDASRAEIVNEGRIEGARGIFQGGGDSLIVDNRATGEIEGSDTGLQTFRTRAVVRTAGVIVAPVAMAFDASNPFDDVVTLAPGSRTEGAIGLGAGDDVLDLFAGASLAGLVDGESGHDTLNLRGAAGQTSQLNFGGTNAPNPTPMFGFERIGKADHDRWILIGDGSALTADLSASGGELVVNGSIPGVDVSLSGPGTTLSGSGIVGALLAGDGTILSPGSSIGTLTVNGDYTPQTGSRLLVEITAAGQADLIDVRGDARIGGGVVEVITNEPASAFTDGQKWVIVDAVGSVNGVFDGVSDADADLDFALAYDPQQVLLLLTGGGGGGGEPNTTQAPDDIQFVRRAVVVTARQHHEVIARRLHKGSVTCVCHMDGAPAESGYWELAFAPGGAMVGGAKPPARGGAIDAIDSRIGAAHGLGEQAGRRREAQGLQDPTATIFGGLTGSYGRIHGVGNQADADYGSGTVAAGLDFFVLPNAVLGLSGGYGLLGGQTEAGGASVDSRTVTLAVHGSMVFTPFTYGDVVLSHSWTEADKRRHANGGVASSSTKARTLALSARLGGDRPLTPSIVAGGHVGATASWSSIDGYAETATGSATPFTVAAQTVASATVEAGARLAFPRQHEWGVSVAQVSVGIGRRFGEDGDRTTATPVGGTVGLNTLVGEEDRTVFSIGAGANATFTASGAQIAASLGVGFSSRGLENVTAGFGGRIRF